MAKRNDDVVDSILQELRQKSTGAASPKEGALLDDILAEINLGSAESERLVPKPQQAMPTRRQATKPVPPPKEAPPPKPVYDTAAFAAAKEKKVERPERKEETTRVMRAEEIKKEAVKPNAGKTSIWDIRVENDEGAMPRVGKAAALDRVDPDKYRKDKALLDYFSDYGDAPMSKKEQKSLEREQKRAEKERKKEEAARRRAQLLHEEEEHDEEEDEELFSSGFPQEEEAYGEEYADEAYSEEEYPEEEYLEDAAAYNDFDEPMLAQQKQATHYPQSRPLGQDFFIREDEPAADDGNFFALQPASSAGATATHYSEEPGDGDLIGGSAFDTPWESTDWAGGDEVLDAAEEEARATVRHDTKFFHKVKDDESLKVPTGAFTQEFTEITPEEVKAKTDTFASKSLYVDDIVDDRFREFFSEAVIVDKDDLLDEPPKKEKRKRKRRRQMLTGEFTKLAFEAEEEEAEELEEDYEEYNHPQDAPAIEKSISSLQTSLMIRFWINGALTLLLLWMGLGAAAILPLPGFVSLALHPLAFSLVNLGLVLAMVIVNFSTIAPGLVGLVSEPTVDSAPALAGVGVLLQAVVVVVQILTGSALNATLFGGIAALLLAVNALGKAIRARSILDNFHLTSAGIDHSAAYVLDSSEDLTYDVTRGLDEDDPCLLVSRPTALVKGFMRQSFSPRWSDSINRILGWVLFGVAAVVTIIVYVQTKQILAAISAFAGVLCIGAPLTSSIVSGLPSLLLQRDASKVGAVVPGWSAIEELGQVNVVMAGARDVFPPASIGLHGLRAFEMKNINNAILYAASVVIEGCDSLRDIFLALVNSKTESLYKVESLTTEPGRGFTAWVDQKRIVLGTREMLQKHDIDPPPMEQELQYINDASQRPLYLAVSGKLYGMFVIGYTADEEVQNTLEGLLYSGVSLLVTSDDMNMTSDLIEEVYALPKGLVKVLGTRELEMLEPLTAYLDESEGVMSHIGSFTSFIGGMRAAAGCASAERMGTILQIISVSFASLLCIVLAFFGGLANIAIFPVLLFQLAWSLVAVAIPFGRRL